MQMHYEKYPQPEKRFRVVVDIPDTCIQTLQLYMKELEDSVARMVVSQ